MLYYCELHIILFYCVVNRKWLSSLLILVLPRLIVEILLHHSLLLIMCLRRYCSCEMFNFDSSLSV